MKLVEKRVLKYGAVAIAVLLLLAVKPALLALALVSGVGYVILRLNVFGRVGYSVRVKFLAVISAMTLLFLFATLTSFGSMDNMHNQVHTLQEMETFQSSLVRAALDGINGIAHRRSLSPIFGLSIVIAVLWLGAAMAWSVTGPLRTMRQGMRRIASGDFDHPVEVQSRDELGELAHMINDTAQELARLHQMTLAEERARALRDRITQVTLAQEEERRRISRELHDGLGPSLAAMGNRVRVCKTMVQTDPKGAERELDEIAGGIKGYIQEIRELIYELRPLALDQLGLTGALGQYVGRFGEETGIHASFKASGDIALNPLADVTVLRVIQECLANVRSHSEASQVDVSVQANGAELEIRVQDDGLGFDPSDAATDGVDRGVGLLSMRERAELLGGSLEIDSAPGRGCRVVLNIPSGEVEIGPDNGPVG